MIFERQETHSVVYQMKMCIMRSYINEGEIHWGMAEIKAASGDHSDPTEVSYTMVMRTQKKPV